MHNIGILVVHKKYIFNGVQNSMYADTIHSKYLIGSPCKTRFNTSSELCFKVNVLFLLYDVYTNISTQVF